MIADSFYGDILTEYFQHPLHAQELDICDTQAQASNPSCGDNLQLQIRFDGDRIAALGYTLTGCALARASAEILATLLIGRTRSQALAILDAFTRLLQGQLQPEDTARLGDATALKSAAAMPLRVKCVSLAWDTASLLLSNR